jgi:hypothetical protein
VLLYYNLINNNKLVAWYLNNISFNLREHIRTNGIVKVSYRYETQIERNKVAKQKYINKGFTYVTKTYNDKPIGKFNSILRNIRDNKSYIIPFDKYLDISS